MNLCVWFLNWYAVGETNSQDNAFSLNDCYTQKELLVFYVGSPYHWTKPRHCECKSYTKRRFCRSRNRDQNTEWAKSRYTLIIYILYTVYLFLAHLVHKIYNKEQDSVALKCEYSDFITEFLVHLPNIQLQIIVL